MSSRALAGDDLDRSVTDDGASQQVMTNDKSSTTEAVRLGGAQITVPIASDLDIVAARERGRMLAVELGYPAIQATLIATAISELARNIALYAAQGEIVLATAIDGNRIGIIVTARDQGPGIQDVARTIAGEYFSSGGSRLGLAGVRRLMDSFEISSQAGQGTTVTVTCWKR